MGWDAPESIGPCRDVMTKAAIKDTLGGALGRVAADVAELETVVTKFFEMVSPLTRQSPNKETEKEREAPLQSSQAVRDVFNLSTRIRRINNNMQRVMEDLEM